MPENRLLSMLRALRDGGVDFILVGGLAGTLHGSPVVTFDVDIAHSREPANITRLLTVLKSLDAIFRIQPERRLVPNATHLSGRGHLNLITRYGPLDVLCTVGENLGYDELLTDADSVSIGEGITIRVLRLEKLIELKESLATEKDRAMLAVLRRTLLEKKKRDDLP